MKCDWKTVKIKDIISFVVDNRGKTPPTRDCGFPLIEVNAVSATMKYPQYQEVRKYVSVDIYSSWFRKGHPRKGDILVPTVGTLGAVSFVDRDDFCIAQNLIALRCDEKHCYSQFLYYFLCDPNTRQRLLNLNIGGVQPSIKVPHLLDFEIDLPPLSVQAGIANLLSSLDEKNTVNQQINDNLYQLLDLSFRNNYFDVSAEHPEWQLVTLDDVTSKFATGLNPRKNFVLGHGNNYYVTIKNMGNNRIYLDDRCDMVDDEALVKINNRSDLQVGDLLFSGIGTIGRVYLIDRPATNWNTSESIFTIRPNADVSSEFLYLLLLNHDMQDYAVSLASGSVQKGIRMADLKRYKLYLPTAEQMTKLTAIWRPLIAKIKENEYENDSLALLRDTLLPKLMSGEIDVSDIQI